MSNAAVISKVLNPSASQQDKTMNTKKKAFRTDSVNNLPEKDAVNAAECHGEQSVSCRNTSKDPSKKDFGQFYEDAINQSDDEHNPGEETISTESTQEILRQNNVNEHPQPVETMMPVPEAALTNSTLSPQSMAEHIPTPSDDVQQGGSAEQPAKGFTAKVPVVSQTLPAQVENPVQAMQSSSPQSHQSTEVQPSRPTEIPLSSNPPLNPVLPNQAQSTPATEHTVDNALLQNHPNPPKMPEAQSDNNSNGQPGRDVSSGQSQNVPVPEHVTITNQTARDRLSQPLPRGPIASETPQKPTFSPTTEQQQHQNPVKAEPDQVELSGKKPFSNQNGDADNEAFQTKPAAPGQEVRNSVSVEHVAQPAEHASVQAVQTPSRLGPVSESEPSASTASPAEQIVHRVAAEWNGIDQTIRLTLNPAQLGAVRITFSRINDEVVGMLEVQKADTRREIEQALPQLLSAIQDNGVPLRKIELLQWDANQQGDKDDQPDQYDLSQQREFSESNTPDPSMSGQGQNHGQSDGVPQAVENRLLNMDAFDDDKADEGLNLFI